MEFLRKLFVQTQDHLKGLTVSQKLAIGSCVALIVVALMWMMKWAGDPVMVPLLDQTIAAEELGPIQSKLDGLGVQYRITGDRILVPSDAQYRVRAQLAEARVLPQDMRMGFAKLIEQNSSPWQNMAEQDRRWSLALSTEVAKVLREIGGISDARVFLDKTTRRTIGQPPVTPTASVFLMPRPGVKLTPEKLTAIATMVSATVGGLDPTNVKVADMATGRSYTVPTDEEGEAYGDLAARKERELHFANKIKELLGHIPGVLVAVHAELDEDATQILEEKHGKPIVLKEESENEASTQGRGAAEPGVNPNTSVAIAPGASSQNMEKTRSETTFDGKVDRTVTKIDKPRYVIRNLYASINVPRSYLAAIFRGTHDKEPTDVDLETFATPELGKIKDQAMRALALTGDADQAKQVQVDWFHDDVAMQLSGERQAGTTNDVISLVRAYGSKAGLGVLAIMSLLMMLMLVRRVGEGPVLPGEEAATGRLVRAKGRKKKHAGQVEMDVDDDSVGEALVSDPLLVGREVDAQTLQAQKIVEQVRQLVTEDPDSSVGILKRWIDTDQG